MNIEGVHNLIFNLIIRKNYPTGKIPDMCPNLNQTSLDYGLNHRLMLVLFRQIVR